MPTWKLCSVAFVLYGCSPLMAETSGPGLPVFGREEMQAEWRALMDVSHSASDLARVTLDAAQSNTPPAEVLPEIRKRVRTVEVSLAELEHGAGGPPRSLAETWHSSLPSYLDPDPFLIRPSNAGMGRELDRTLGGGLSPGQTAGLVAAGSGRSKTALLQQWGDGQAEASATRYKRALQEGVSASVTPVLFVSEMPVRDLTLRTLARLAGVDGSLLRDPRGAHGCRPLGDGVTIGEHALAQAARAAQRFRDAARFITVLDRRVHVTVADLETAVHRIRASWEAAECEVPAVLVIVDPIHRLLDPTRPEVEALGVALPAILDLAQRCEAVVLFTSDTTKAAVYGRSDAAAKPSGEALAERTELAFRGSYQLLHMPDFALGLVTLSAQSEALSPEDAARLAQEPRGTMYAEIVNAKSRWSPVGRRAAFWLDPAKFRFRPTTSRELPRELSLAERVIVFVEANPDSSENAARKRVEGRDKAIRETVKSLLNADLLEDHGSSTTGRRLRKPGTPQGTRPEQPSEQPREQGEGREVVPGALPGRGEPPSGTTLSSRFSGGTKRSARPDSVPDRGGAMMAPHERADRARLLCERLHREVSDFTPPGLSREDWAWEAAAPADAEFMETLSAWQADPTELARLRVRDTYFAVVSVWRESAARYLEEKAAR